MSKLTYSIFELFSDDFLDAKGEWCFVIPEYQRGYKWGEAPIIKLLNDIDRFDIRGEDEKFYCLNNLTIVKHDEAGIEYYVVDGQQRLTTITVILACMRHIDDKLEFPKFQSKIKYNIREITQDFLTKLVNDDNFGIDGSSVRFHELFQGEDTSSWNVFVESYDEFDYQDIFYLFNAYKSIRKWLFEHEKTRKEFIYKLLHHVKLIVNNVPDVESEATLFGNLNSNKVQLDGADLVRALIITNVARIETDEIDDVLKRKLVINEKRVRIGIQIDTIMHWWKDKSHQKFYQILSKTVKTDMTSNVEFDEKKNPLNYLYKIYTRYHKEKTIALENFEKDIVSQWKEIQQLQRILEQWYDDDKLYHALGFIFFRYSQSIKIEDIFKEWNYKSIGNFYKYLLDNISKNLFVNKSDQSNNLSETEYEKICFEENWYEDDNVIPIMILLDIIHEERNGKRLPVDMFTSNGADKEHIFPQTPLGAVTNKKEIGDRKTILKEYVNLVNECVDGQDKVNISDPIDKWDDTKMQSKDLEELQTEINEKIKKVIPINCLGNICLLDKCLNRSYGNDFYTAKRLAVVNNYFNGSYIRPHVIEAFDKSWEKRESDKISNDIMNLWKKDDIIKRRKYIYESINSYLTGKWKEE